MRHAALECPQRLSHWRCVSTAGKRETQGSGSGAGLLAFGLRASRLSPSGPSTDQTAPSSVFRGIHGTLRRTSAAVRVRRGHETAADRDLIKGHAMIAFTTMTRAVSRLRNSSSGAADAAVEQQRQTKLLSRVRSRAGRTYLTYGSLSLHLP